MIVDVHAHLEHKDFEKDIDKVIKRAEQNNVVKIINSGTDQLNNEKTLELAKKYKIVEASLGFYPHEALKLNDKEIDRCLEFIKKNKNKIISIGEVGLDYTEGEKEKQKEVFQKIINLVEELNLPVIVHSRKAEKDAVEMLESSNIKKIIMHCFSGSMKLVKRVEDNGWMLSIPTIITFSSHFQTVVDRVNMQQLLTETDAPFLSPIRGKRNEPSFITYTIKKISEIKKLNEEEVKKIIFMNFQRIFLK